MIFIVDAIFGTARSGESTRTHTEIDIWLGRAEYQNTPADLARAARDPEFYWDWPYLLFSASRS